MSRWDGGPLPDPDEIREEWAGDPDAEEPWRGNLHPATDDPGWPEPANDEPGEYGLPKEDAEREDGDDGG